MNNQEINLLKKENIELKKEIAELKQKLAKLQELVQSLKEQLSKDSHNSSKPPSSDGFKKKTKSLRKPSGKKPGGQKGHVGHTLEMVQEPDFTVTHKIHECERCNCSLDSEEIYKLEKRQVFDIPAIKMEVTEHRAEMKKCPACGLVNKAKFPTGASNIVQYGDRVSALGNYLSNYQLIPLNRVKEFFFDLFKHPISKATLISMNKRTYDSLESFADAVREKIIHSPVVNVDESGFYCENKRQWLHSTSTERITYYRFHQKRGKIAMDEIGILPVFKGMLVHDFWTPYQKYSCYHALCNAHHLRELVFIFEEKKRPWAGLMQTLLLDIKEKVDACKTNPGVKSLESRFIEEFENRYDQIIEAGIKAEPPPPATDPALPKKRGRQKKSKSMNLLYRFKEHKEKVLGFMYNFEVPFDNNLAERDIRMIKLQQKISGTFRTGQGAMVFCRIRSYISTARKNGINVFHAINNAVKGQPFCPT